MDKSEDPHTHVRGWKKLLLFGAPVVLSAIVGAVFGIFLLGNVLPRLLNECFDQTIALPGMQNLRHVEGLRGLLLFAVLPFVGVVLMMACKGQLLYIVTTMVGVPLAYLVYGLVWGILSLDAERLRRPARQRYAFFMIGLLILMLIHGLLATTLSIQKAHDSSKNARPTGAGYYSLGPSSASPVIGTKRTPRT